MELFFLSSSCHLIVCTECQLDSLSLTTPWVEWKKQKHKVVVFWTKVVVRLWPTGQLNVRDKNIQRWAKFNRMFSAGGAWLTWLTRGWWSTWCISPTLVGRWRHHSYPTKKAKLWRKKNRQKYQMHLEPNYAFEKIFLSFPNGQSIPPLLPLPLPLRGVQRISE